MVMNAYDKFDEQKQFACRVIADHARATAFSIADGILPGNEGRNYVLRKIMRRAIYQGRHALGLEDAFFYKVTNFVVDQMGGAYPELGASREFIEKMVKLEEERFGSTLVTGLQKLDPLFKELFQTWERHGASERDLKRLTAVHERLESTSDELFKDFAKLYDTFGTPLDLLRVTLEEYLRSDRFTRMWAENLRPDF